MATYKQLLAQKEALEAKLVEVRSTEVAGLIEQIRALMEKYGLSIEDIVGKPRRGRPAGSGAAKAAKESLPPSIATLRRARPGLGVAEHQHGSGSVRNAFLLRKSNRLTRLTWPNRQRGGRQ